MRRFLFLTILFFNIGITQAIEIDPSYYIYPVENVARLYSANFGELRPDHFHSGVDIKTDGVEGKRVVAVADGYISRLGLSPSGYGLALYIIHPNGTTSVYGHLSRFRNDLAKRVQQERYKEKKHSISLFFKADEYPVKQGDLIAYSGNSGSSSGPHLHYEIRESATHSPLNIFALGIIKPRDTRRPWFRKLHYIEVDTLNGVAYHSPRKTYPVLNPSMGQYVVDTPNNTIEVGRTGYFVAEVTDRKNDVTNTFGIYSFEAQVDSVSYFKFQMDRFTFTTTRYVNAVSCYALKLGQRNEVIRVAQQECGTGQFYPIIKNRGVVECEEGQLRTVRMVTTDDCALTATLNFNIVGSKKSFAAKPDTLHPIIRATESFNHSSDGVRVSIPARALYESIPYRCETLPFKNIEIDSLVRVASPVYKILCDSIPLHKAIKISISAPLSEEDAANAIIAKVSRKGIATAVGGTYKDGEVTLESRSAGSYFVAIDNTPPTIEANFDDGAELSIKRALSFTVSDNFSAITEYNATINGEWVALEYSRGRLIHNILSEKDGPYMSKRDRDGYHTIQVEVVDGCGNRASMERKFMWEDIQL